jgi:hypothetical protein
VSRGKAEVAHCGYVMRTCNPDRVGIIKLNCAFAEASPSMAVHIISCFCYVRKEDGPGLVVTEAELGNGVGLASQHSGG